MKVKYQKKIKQQADEILYEQEKRNEEQQQIRQQYPLNWNSPCRGEGASHQEVSTQVHQREELNWASQLKSSDQQIFSTMSST